MSTTYNTRTRCDIIFTYDTRTRCLEALQSDQHAVHIDAHAKASEQIAEEIICHERI